MVSNYLQRMAGNLGLGMGRRGMGVDPRRRMAQQLMAQGVDTSPARLGTGIGRLGKALAAAYMMRQSEDQETDAMKWMIAQQPDRFRQPTETEAYAASPDLQALNFASNAETDSPLAEMYPEGLEHLRSPSNLERKAPTIPVAEQYQKDNPVSDSVDTDKYFKNMNEAIQRKTDLGMQPEPLESAGEFAPTSLPLMSDQVGGNQIQGETFTEESPRVGPRDYAQELASGMGAYQRDPANQISDPRTRMEWLRESASGKEGNPLIRRMLQNMMFAKMQRDISQEDIKSKRAFTTSERLAGEGFRAGESALDRTSKERAAKLRAVGEDPNKWKTWLNADQLSPEKFEKFLLTIRGYSPKDIGGTLHTPMLSKPDQGVGKDTEITLGPEQELPYIKDVEETKQKAKLDAKYMDDLTRMQPKASGLVKSFKAKTEFMQNNVKDAIANISGWSTAYGAALSGWPRSQAQALARDLLTIKANVGFQALQEMRSNSPTGGALGQVSERELEFLQATLGDLSQTQDGAILTKKLQAMLAHVEGMDKRIKDAYDLTFQPLTEAQGGDGNEYYIPNPPPSGKKNRRQDDDPMKLGL